MVFESKKVFQHDLISDKLLVGRNRTDVCLQSSRFGLQIVNPSNSRPTCHKWCINSLLKRKLFGNKIVRKRLNLTWKLKNNWWRSRSSGWINQAQLNRISIQRISINQWKLLVTQWKQKLLWISSLETNDKYHRYQQYDSKTEECRYHKYVSHAFSHAIAVSSVCCSRHTRKNLKVNYSTGPYPAKREPHNGRD